MLEITARLMRTLIDDHPERTEISNESLDCNVKFCNLAEKITYNGVKIPYCLLPFVKSAEKKVGLQQVIDGTIQAQITREEDQQQNRYFLKIKRNDKRLSYYAGPFVSEESVKEALIILLCDYMKVDNYQAIMRVNQMKKEYAR